ncbi:MAG: helix-turn-helix domain-containing protein [Flavobacteriales bacterium]|jgi:excisionase family DNA binding protein
MDKVVFTSLPVEEIEGIITRAVQQSIAGLLNPQPQGDPDELVTRKQAAQLLGVSLPTLHDYTTRGIIPGYRIGTRVRYKKGEILDCLRKVQAAKYRAA